MLGSIRNARFVVGEHDTAYLIRVATLARGRFARATRATGLTPAGRGGGDWRQRLVTTLRLSSHGGLRRLSPLRCVLERLVLCSRRLVTTSRLSSQGSLCRLSSHRSLCGLSPLWSILGRLVLSSRSDIFALGKWAPIIRLPATCAAAEHLGEIGDLGMDHLKAGLLPR